MCWGVWTDLHEANNTPYNINSINKCYSQKSFCLMWVTTYGLGLTSRSALPQ